jgi:hypothetical protein
MPRPTWWWKGSCGPPEPVSSGDRGERRPAPAIENLIFSESLHCIRERRKACVRARGIGYSGFRELATSKGTWLASRGKVKVPACPQPGGPPEIRASPMLPVAYCLNVRVRSKSPYHTEGWLHKLSALPAGTAIVPSDKRAKHQPEMRCGSRWLNFHRAKVVVCM